MFRFLAILIATFYLATGAVAQDDWKTLVSETATGFEVEGAKKVEPEEALALLHNGVTFVDVRRSTQYNLAHIEGAVNLELKTQLNEDSLTNHVSRDQTVVFYCSDAGCYRSAHASAMALSWGFNDVVYYADGMSAWLANDFPRN